MPSPTIHTSPETIPSAYSVRRRPSYPVLRLVAAVYLTAAILMGAATLVLPVLVLLGLAGVGTLSFRVGVALIMFLAGGLGTLTLAAVPELIRLLLNIEANTQRLLER